MVRKLSFRITDIVIRCPNCKKTFRIAVALVEKKRREPIEPKIDNNKEASEEC